MDDTATHATDYIHQNTSITFKAKESLKTLRIKILNDRNVESDEVLKIKCTTNNTNVDFLSSCMANNLTVEIKDDDIDIDCSSARVNEHDGNASIFFNRTGALTYISHIFCTTVDDTAMHPNDYVHQNSTITFGQGESSKTFVIPLVNHRHVESNEYLKINCTTNSTNVDFLPSCTTNNLRVDIKDNDIDIDCTSDTVNEHEGSASIVFNRTGALSYTTHIYCITMDDTAMQPFDYIHRNSTITFGTGQFLQTFSIRVVNDRNVESDESFKINCTTSDTNVDFLQTCRTNNLKIEIKDDDVDIDCKSETVNEHDGNATIVFNRTGALSYTTNIHCTTLDDTAIYPYDYHHQNTSIIFGPNETWNTLTVPVLNDGYVELDEVLRINCTTNNTNVDFLPSCFTGNLKVDILNDDIYLHCVNTTIVVFERTQQISVTVEKEGLLHLNTTFWVQTVDGTAFAKADYQPMTKKEFTFATGQKYLTFTIEIVDESYDEKDETFNITIGVDTSMIKYPTVVIKEHCSTVLIKDDDIDTSSVGLTKQQAEELEKKKNVTIILLSVGMALICIFVVVLIVLVFLVI